MRKLLLFACALFGFMACTQNPIEEQSAIRVDVPETIRVGFEDDETRIQLNSAQKTVWTKDDLVSVFYRSDANQKWQYQGETGERVGDLKCVDAGTATESMKRVVVVYPYNENYYINTETYNVQATLPATQHYLANSYGTDGNIMVSSSEYNQFSLKSVCGWLKLQLMGDGEVVKSIKFRGNDGEQVAGELYINSTDATAALASDMGDTDDNNAGGNLVFDDTILTEIVLDCGEGVTLGKSATAFYIALPPQTFANGFTVEIEDTDGYAMEQSTAKTFVVERNTISPMAALEFVNPNRPTQPTQPTPENNEIWYTATAKAEPYFDDFVTFGSDVVSNVWDSETKRGIITFDGDVTMIGDEAFYNCDKFTGITLPESVTSIGKKAFYYCDGLTEFIIPDSVITIGNEAFAGCSSLTSVTIGNSVTTIGNYAFYDCSSLTSVTIGDSVTMIGSSAFEDCSSLTSVTIPDSVTTIGSSAFEDCSSLTSVTIGNSVTTIGMYAFAYCYDLTSVTIGNSVTTIRYKAFYNCSSLTSVTIPDSVTTIGESAFAWCSSLQEFKGKFASEDGRCLIIDGTLSVFAPAGLTEYTIPDSVTTIVGWVFGDCSSLTSITIGDSVTTIGSSAFHDCSSLTSVTIPDSVTTIGSYAFCDCDSLTSITIPNSVTTIGRSAFYYCESLTSVTIGDSVTTIGEYAFYSCSSLTSVTIPDSVTTIGSSAFRDCSSLTSVTIPDSVTTIGNLAFYGCDSLTSVTIGNSVTTIGNYAFEYCSSLTSVTIPDSVTSIGVSAFSGCSSLQEFNGKFASEDGRCLIIDGVLNSFAPAGLTEYAIPDSVTTIGESAFTYCGRLTSVTIPDSVTTIGYCAFYDCTSLTSVYCKATTPPVALTSSWYWSAFDDNASGRKIYVPMESVGAYKSASYWSRYADAIVGYDF